MTVRSHQCFKGQVQHQYIKHHYIILRERTKIYSKLLFLTSLRSMSCESNNNCCTTRADMLFGILMFGHMVCFVPNLEPRVSHLFFFCWKTFKCCRKVQFVANTATQLRHFIRHFTGYFSTKR